MTKDGLLKNAYAKTLPYLKYNSFENATSLHRLTTGLQKCTCYWSRTPYSLSNTNKHQWLKGSLLTKRKHQNPYIYGNTVGHKLKVTKPFSRSKPTQVSFQWFKHSAIAWGRPGVVALGTKFLAGTKFQVKKEKTK